MIVELTEAQAEELDLAIVHRVIDLEERIDSFKSKGGCADMLERTEKQLSEIISADKLIANARIKYRLSLIRGGI